MIIASIPVRSPTFFHQDQLVQQCRRDRVQETGGLRQQHATALIEHIDRIGQKEMPLGSCYGHIKQPPFFFQFLVSNKRIDRREPAIHYPNDEHTLPLQPFCRMDRGQHQSLIIAIGCIHIDSTAIRRLQREIRQRTASTPDTLRQSSGDGPDPGCAWDNRRTVLSKSASNTHRHGLLCSAGRKSSAPERLSSVCARSLSPFPTFPDTSRRVLIGLVRFHNCRQEILRLLRPHALRPA